MLQSSSSLAQDSGCPEMDVTHFSLNQVICPETAVHSWAEAKNSDCRQLWDFLPKITLL